MKLNSLTKPQLFLVFIAFLTSCNLGDEAVPPTITENSFELWEKKEPIIENEYLVFDNINHLVAYSSYINKLTNDERQGWEEKLGFKSMRTDYEEFLTYSEASIESGYDMSLDQIRTKYKHTLILKDDGDFFLNTPIYSFANILNQQGLVKVGKGLQKHTKDRIITIEDGNLNKLPLAMILDENDKKQGIIVNHVINNSIMKEKCGIINQGSGSWPGIATILFNNTWGFQSHGNSNDKYRLEVDVISFEWASSPNYASSYIYMKTQSRGFAGGWYAKKADTDALVNSASITNNQGFSETISNVTKSKNDNKWSFYLFSPLSSDNPIESITGQANGGTWDEVCFDLKFISKFKHNSHSHTYTVFVN